MRDIKDQKGFIGLISLLLTLVIIVFISYKIYNVYLSKPSVDTQTKKMLTEQGIDTSSQQGVLESTKAKLKDVNKMMLERENQYMDQAGQYQK